MKRRWTRAAIVGAAGAVLGPAAATPAFAARPVPTGAAAGASTPVAKLLGEIADSAANRNTIVFNNLAALWRSAGLPSVPSIQDLAPAKGKGFQAINEIVEGSVLGSEQLPYAAGNPAPFGYNVLALHQELVVGPLPEELTEVWGPIQAGPVASALRKLKAVQSRAGSTELFDLRAAASRQPANYIQLQGISRFALPGGGGRLVGAGVKFPEAALTGLVEGEPQKDSLASDPAVKQLLAAFPSDATTLTMGTSMVGGDPLGKNASPAARRELLTRSGLGKVHAAPTMAGLAFSGPPDAVRVTAAAVYPDASDAKAAAAAVGAYLRTGTNPLTNRRWSGPWQLTGTSTDGDTAVVELTTKTPQDVTNTIDNADFPLFWKL